jgi:hypothetical protein
MLGRPWAVDPELPFAAPRDLESWHYHSVSILPAGGSVLYNTDAIYPEYLVTVSSA